jgi:hypothetical protein
MANPQQMEAARYIGTQSQGSTSFRFKYANARNAIQKIEFKMLSSILVKV